jgi:7-cyano-7-deazaguanine synthase in queuosine biosynthesis
MHLEHRSSRAIAGHETAAAADARTRHILWSGGWDSTFCVLHAALTQRHCVQPYYLIDTGRDSTLHELRAIERIRKDANARCGSALIAPVVYANSTETEADPEITQWFSSLQARMHVGTQYEWLARFARAHAMHALELAVEKYPPGTESPLYVLLRDNTEGQGHERAFRRFPSDDLRLFERFRFPVIHLIKHDMGNIAVQEGFDDLMQLTWFCHRPVLGVPCGTCRPCVLARQSGRSLGGNKRTALRGLLQIGWRLARRYRVERF